MRASPSRAVIAAPLGRGRGLTSRYRRRERELVLQLGDPPASDLGVMRHSRLQGFPRPMAVIGIFATLSCSNSKRGSGHSDHNDTSLASDKEFRSIASPLLAPAPSISYIKAPTPANRTCPSSRADVTPSRTLVCHGSGPWAQSAHTRSSLSAHSVNAVEHPSAASSLPCPVGHRELELLKFSTGRGEANDTAGSVRQGMD